MIILTLLYALIILGIIYAVWKAFFSLKKPGILKIGIFSFQDKKVDVVIVTEKVVFLGEQNIVPVILTNIETNSSTPYFYSFKYDLFANAVFAINKEAFFGEEEFKKVKFGTLEYEVFKAAIGETKY